MIKPYPNLLKKAIDNGKPGARSLKEQIRKECCISRITLKEWLEDPAAVPLLARYIIADVLQLPVEELFPPHRGKTISGKSRQ